MTSLSIPSTVTDIGSASFYRCFNLGEVVLPKLTTIKKWTFEECTSLTSIIIPGTVVSIEDRAFYGCTKLTSMVIPNSVTSIGDTAFGGASADFVITCQTGSTAQSYANAQSIQCKALNMDWMEGDLDGDNKITVFDAMSALQIASGEVIATPFQIKAGDLDGDGIITSFEALRILQKKQ